MVAIILLAAYCRWWCRRRVRVGGVAGRDGWVVGWVSLGVCVLIADVLLDEGGEKAAVVGEIAEGWGSGG